MSSSIFQEDLILSSQIWMGLGLALSILVLVHLLCVRRSPSSTLAWALVVVLFPFFGAPLYLILGGRKLSCSGQGRAMALQRSRLPHPQAKAVLSSIHPLDHLLQANSVPAATCGNHFRILRSGSAAREALFDLITTAHREVFVAVFVLTFDNIGRAFIEQLTKRARSGLDVFLLLDGLGGCKIGERHLRSFLEAGGMTARFTPLLKGSLRGQLRQLHLRNHRKLVVADGMRAWSGGMNIADCYLHDDPPPWRDLGFFVEGPAARLMRELFLSDWRLAKGQKRDLALSRGSWPVMSRKGDDMIQILPSGPDIATDPLHAALLAASYGARERLWIMSPFFIPDDALMTAWKIAAQRGVDLRVYVGRRSLVLMDWARRSYLKEIQAAGGRVLQINTPRLHAKAIVVDRNIAMLGSANIDYRSLFLNYELMAIVYTPQIVEALAEEMIHMAEMAEEGIHPAGLMGDLVSGVTRMIAPLL